MSNAEKKNKRLIKLFNRDLLKFKLLNDELQIINEEDSEGSLDLLFRIESFMKKLPEEKAKKLGEEFGFATISGKTELAKHDDSPVEQCEEDVLTVTSEKHNPGGWQKKLLREIVKKTHPDKVSNYSESDRAFYVSVYLSATDSYNAGKPVELMSSGHDVRLKPAPVRQAHLSLISERHDHCKKEASAVRKNHGFIWYHLAEIEKEIFLINYMAQLGYSINKVEAASVIKRKRPPSRKPGSRPENLLKKRVKKTPQAL